MRDIQTKDLKNKLLEIYDDENHKKYIEIMNDDNILELAQNLKMEFLLLHPVFDGAKEKDITKLLESSGVSSSGQEDSYMMVLPVKSLKDLLQLVTFIC